jgi:hypothetical protein
MASASLGVFKFTPFVIASVTSPLIGPGESFCACSRVLLLAEVSASFSPCLLDLMFHRVLSDRQMFSGIRCSEGRL